MNTVGLYIHVPFCVSKCPYCDFYSVALPSDAMLDAYAARVCDTLDVWAARLPEVTADTLYFGGGTPSLLGGERLAAILRRARARFGLSTAEITLEANPADDLYDTLSAFAAEGGNRLSLGMQSICAAELTALGRRHTPPDVARTVADAHRVGINNVSLDIMLGVPEQTTDSARHSAQQAAALGATHVSAYMLKIEPNTPFGRCTPSLPDEDATADAYLAVMDTLDTLGYHQYEISNAALIGRESRHNLKYWHSEPYLGIGPAASSCIGDRRFSYARDIDAFMRGEEPTDEPCSAIAVGSPEEYALLRLRLSEGVTAADFAARFGDPMPSVWFERARRLPKTLVCADGDGIRLTRDGFLVSNTLITHILTK